MFGNNPIRKPEKGDGSSLDIQQIFATVQGEGPFAGALSVFVRLGGCNLACHFCDTEFESFGNRLLGDILKNIDEKADSNGAWLIVITGGEPFRQPIESLCEALLAKGYAVQIETNGTLWRPIPAQVSIVCSPKAPNGRYAPLREDLLERATALKFLVSATDSAYNTVPDVGQSRFSTPVYIQALDEYDPQKNAQNFAYAINLAATQGFKLSVQVHKLIGVE